MKSLPTLLGLALGLVFWIPHTGAAKEPPLRSATEQEVEDQGTDFVAEDRFATALKAWLDDDDPVALPMLSRLATEGHVPAQVFLGRIANRVASEYVEGLSREDRNRLLRAPGGLSGTSWLAVAANSGSPLARALHASQLPPYTVSKVRSLLDHAEIAEATTFLLRSADSGRVDGVEQLLEEVRLPAISSYSVWLSIVHFGVMSENTVKQLRQFLSSTGPGGILVAAAFSQKYGAKFPPHLKTIAARISGDIKALPGKKSEIFVDPGDDVSLPFGSLHSYCSRFCEIDIPKCLYDGVVLVGGYNEFWKLMSPVESYITTTRYHQSKRAAADVARHMRSKSFAWGPKYSQMIRAESCAASALADD